jgi:Lon protease-like protein
MKLPPEIAVMSLPNAILFPQVVLPLHIFEPRYRAMLRDALDTHRLFSVALMRGEPQAGVAEPEPHDVACVGIVRAAINLPDGTSNVLLQGVSRVRFTRYVEGKPYRLAEIAALPTTHAIGITPDVLAAKVADLLRARGALGFKMPENLMKTLVKVRDADTLADMVSFLLIQEMRDKQEMLETLDLRLRLRKLMRLFQSEIDQLNAQRQAPGPAPDKEFGPN